MPWPSTSRQLRGYGRAWELLRDAVLKRDSYLCQCRHCKYTKRVKPASEVDHIIPKERGGTDMMSNLQAINSECHKRKTLEDRGIKPVSAIGTDGYPIDG